jgi:hypothetical protein
MTRTEALTEAMAEMMLPMLRCVDVWCLRIDVSFGDRAWGTCKGVAETQQRLGTCRRQTRMDQREMGVGDCRLTTWKQ